jgi:transcriptional regulator with GAF, ATPase, and Fis domain
MDVLRRIESSSSTAFELGKRVMFVGTSSDADVPLLDKTQPDIAAKIEYQNGQYVLEAMKNTIVKVNAKKIKDSALTPGDRIEIGNQVFIYERTVSAPSGPAQSLSPPTIVLESLARFAEMVGAERDLRALLGKIIEILFEVIGGTEAFIFTVNKDNKPEVFVSSSSKHREERFSDTIVQEALRTGTAICIGNTFADNRFSQAQSIIDMKLSSVLCSPIVIAKKTVGIIYLGSTKSTVSFTKENLDTLKLYALLTGMLISHVEFINQQNTIIKKLSEIKGEEGIIAQSSLMRKVIDDVNAVAISDIPVLLQGETGTGKDVIANLFHRKSKRAAGPFVNVNCSSLHGELLESELFGHKRGSFTGAVKDHQGLFRAAHGGTLFLDEIGEMDIGIQAKLLRTIETGMVRSVGATTEDSVDVRIICATNRNLQEMAANKTFREDLFYRLNQFTLHLPPLRDRGDDLLLLASFFLEKYKAEYPAKGVVDFHPDSLKAITFYEWPGNIRELASVIHKSVLTARGPLVTVDLAGSEDAPVNFDQATRDFQNKLINRVLAACKGNREKAAAMLGMSRSTFFRYLAEATGAAE